MEDDQEEDGNQPVDQPPIIGELFILGLGFRTETSQTKSLLLKSHTVAVLGFLIPILGYKTYRNIAEVHIAICIWQWIALTE